jgi:riboflavin biosynthesis pyrimidine reductase
MDYRSSARQDVQHWRAISGAVITGIETVLPMIVSSMYVHFRILISRRLSTETCNSRSSRTLPLTAKILQNPETVMVMTPFRQELADLGVIQLAATFKSIIADLNSSNIKFMMCWLKQVQLYQRPFYKKVWLMK